jgi:hypothetical protein
MEWKPIHDPADIETCGVLETGCHGNDEGIINLHAARCLFGLPHGLS